MSSQLHCSFSSWKGTQFSPSELTPNQHIYSLIIFDFLCYEQAGKKKGIATLAIVIDSNYNHNLVLLKQNEIKRVNVKLSYSWGHLLVFLYGDSFKGGVMKTNTLKVYSLSKMKTQIISPGNQSKLNEELEEGERRLGNTFDGTYQYFPWE